MRASRHPDDFRKQPATACNRMLLVEEDHFIREQYAEYIRTQYPNLILDVAANLQDAADFLQTYRYNAIMLNERFPGARADAAEGAAEKLCAEHGIDYRPTTFGIALLKAIRQSPAFQKNRESPVYYQDMTLTNEIQTEAVAIGATCHEKGGEITNEEKAFFRKHLGTTIRR